MFIMTVLPEIICGFFHPIMYIFPREFLKSSNPKAQDTSICSPQLP